MKCLNDWSAAADFKGQFSTITNSYAGKRIVRYDYGKARGFLPAPAILRALQTKFAPSSIAAAVIGRITRVRCRCDGA